MTTAPQRPHSSLQHLSRQAQPTAAGATWRPATVTITHPQHPLVGLCCKVLAAQANERRLRFRIVHPETGQEHLVNADFTDYVDTNFHDAGDSLPLLDITTLRALIMHVGRLKQTRDDVEMQ